MPSRRARLAWPNYVIKIGHTSSAHRPARQGERVIPKSPAKHPWLSMLRHHQRPWRSPPFASLPPQPTLGVGCPLAYRELSALSHVGHCHAGPWSVAIRQTSSQKAAPASNRTRGYQHNSMHPAGPISQPGETPRRRIPGARETPVACIPFPENPDRAATGGDVYMPCPVLADWIRSS